jgi:hypothetical protein
VNGRHDELVTIETYIPLPPVIFTMPWWAGHNRNIHSITPSHIYHAMVSWFSYTVDIMFHKCLNVKSLHCGRQQKQRWHFRREPSQITAHRQNTLSSVLLS